MSPVWTVLSDLHLFAARSRERGVLAGVIEQARASRVLVLNGDIFDFPWSTYGAQAKTMEAAAEWLCRVAEGAPHCRIVYVLGNHDASRSWADRCAGLAASLPNLHWSPDYYRLGNTLFTHGDLLLGRRGRRTRELEDDYRIRSRLAGDLYAAASAARIPRLVAQYYGGRRCARIVSRNLRDLDAALTAGMSRLCIGHTHRPFTALRSGGVTVYNSGSNIRGMKLNILRLREDESS